METMLPYLVFVTLAQIVYHDDVVAGGIGQTLHEITTDKPGAASDDVHHSLSAPR